MCQATNFSLFASIKSILFSSSRILTFIPRVLIILSRPFSLRDRAEFAFCTRHHSRYMKASRLTSINRSNASKSWPLKSPIPSSDFSSRNFKSFSRYAINILCFPRAVRPSESPLTAGKRLHSFLNRKGFEILALFPSFMQFFRPVTELAVSIAVRRRHINSIAAINSLKHYFRIEKTVSQNDHFNAIRQ